MWIESLSFHSSQKHLQEEQSTKHYSETNSEYYMEEGAGVTTTAKQWCV